MITLLFYVLCDFYHYCWSQFCRLKKSNIVFWYFGVYMSILITILPPYSETTILKPTLFSWVTNVLHELICMHIFISYTITAVIFLLQLFYFFRHHFFFLVSLPAAPPSFLQLYVFSPVIRSLTAHDLIYELYIKKVHVRFSLSFHFLSRHFTPH